MHTKMAHCVVLLALLAAHAHGQAVACTVDVDCEANEFCACGTETATPPPDGSPAAPLARTPLASALSFVGMMLAACQKPVAADPCRCKKGARAADSAATPTGDAMQPVVNATGTDGGFGGAYKRGHE